MTDQRRVVVYPASRSTWRFRYEERDAGKPWSVVLTRKAAGAGWTRSEAEHRARVWARELGARVRIIEPEGGSA